MESFGHIWIGFDDDNGQKWESFTYGMYPNTSVHHPDDPPIDKDRNYDSIDFNLTEEQYNDGLKYAQNQCADRPKYNIATYNCATFSLDVLKEIFKWVNVPKITYPKKIRDYMNKVREVDLLVNGQWEAKLDLLSDYRKFNKKKNLDWRCRVCGYKFNDAFIEYTENEKRPLCPECYNAQREAELEASFPGITEPDNK